MNIEFTRLQADIILHLRQHPSSLLYSAPRRYNYLSWRLPSGDTRRTYIGDAISELAKMKLITKGTKASRRQYYTLSTIGRFIPVPEDLPGDSLDISF